MTSEKVDASSAALAARERGNTFYNAGKFAEAEVAYSESARLTPTDPRPISNISALKYEMGNYVGSALFCEKALNLLQDTPDPALEQKLRLRLAKSYVLARRSTRAQVAVSRITSNEDKKQLEHSVLAMEVSDGLYPDVKLLWETLIERLPRFKTALQNEPEYFSVGHDDAETQFKPQMAHLNQNNYCLLFAGIGDGRNLFATLAYISLMSMSDKSILSKKFHFTLLDIKPTVFARDLLMFHLLIDASHESSSKSSETLVTLSYIFAAQVMPAWAYSRFQLAIDDLLNELRKPDTDVMRLFYVDSKSRALISHHLESWKRKPQYWYSTRAFINLTQDQGLQYRMKTMARYGSESQSGSERPPGCEPGSPDVLGYEDLGVMLPHIHLLEKFESRLLKLFKSYGGQRTPANRQKLNEYLYDQWKPNMTLIDFDYEEKRQGEPTPLLDFTPHGTVSDIFANIPHSVVGRGVRGVLPHLEGFFSFIQELFDRIRDRTTFEIVVSDMVSYFERVEHGLLQKRDRFGPLQPSTFPDRFDGIHMSNIPDYVGGPLTTFIHGLPILRNDKKSTMTSNVLRNPTRWVTHSDFLTEYLLLTNRATISDTFSTSLAEDSARVEEVLDGKIIAGAGAVMSMHMSWVRTSQKPLSWPKLMPRRKLERWLHSHFLKICLPAPRTGDFDNLVMAPLNLSTLFRLINHLSKVGYPAHWLSSILASLSIGEITTTARAPRSMITDAAAVRAVYPPKAISIMPFVTEYRMLLSIWRRLLPFGLIDQDTIEYQLPSLNDIRQYKVEFQVDKYFYDTSRGERSTLAFVLVFWNRTVNGEVPIGRSMRVALLDDESVKSKSFLKSQLRQAGGSRLKSECTLHVVSAIKWERDISTACFWFPSDIVENMASGHDDWAVYIWSTDSWESVLGPVSVKRDSVVSGDAWY
ncbi:hypothetical protein F5Y10DRAFT_30696 [Nemania abortiva]|nr:hypothetical protein F5Y10DRAFT_30696 [Nemania abortiva]